MRPFQRKTTLTLDELKAEFKHPHRMPQCGVISEVGTIFILKEPEAEEAERFLLETLYGTDPMNSIMALCYLLTPNELTPETEARVKTFTDDPRNAIITMHARQLVTSQKSQN